MFDRLKQVGFTLLGAAIGTTAFNSMGQVVITPAGDQHVVTIDGDFFTMIHHGEDDPKPYLYPVMGPGQTPMTRNYPMGHAEGEATDHPHHRSLWFTFGDIDGVDFWKEGPTKGTVQVDQVQLIDEQTIQLICTGISPEQKPVMKHTQTWSFASTEDGGRLVDVTVTYAPLDGQDTLVLGETKEGAMAIRTHPNLRLKNDAKHHVTTANGQAINSEGVSGVKVWGKVADWVDYYGSIDGKTVGVAIFNHTDNFRSPTHWHAREYGLITANPFGGHDFDKSLPEGWGALTVKAQEPLVLKYRLFFHPGDTQQADIPKAYETYVAD